MKKKIFGSRYNYFVELTKSRNYFFEIFAVYKITQQVSVITNLNYLLSELQDETMDKERFFETTWILFDKTEVNKVWTRTIKLFSCDGFIKMLENKLDEDRIQGGWNSDFEF